MRRPPGDAPSEDLAKGFVIQAASVLQRSAEGRVYDSLALAVVVFAVWQGLATRLVFGPALLGKCYTETALMDL